jgi:arginase
MTPTPNTSFTSVTPKQIRVIGVPLDLGQSRRGVDMGPSAVRVAGLEARLEAVGHNVEDGGNVAVAIPEQKKEGAAHAKYLKEITATCTKSAELVMKTLEAGKVPLVLGGDHSVAAGTVAGVAEFYRKQNQKIGLIWIDAHSDMNTPETSPSGNVHGMPLAAIMGLGPNELGNIFNFSWVIRRTACSSAFATSMPTRRKHPPRGVEVFTMRDIDERGMRTVWKKPCA